MKFTTSALVALAASASALSSSSSSCSTKTTSAASSISAAAATASTATPGYFTNFSTIPANSTFSFGKHYAVLNLDMINGLVASVAGTPQGESWINSVTTWINAVHAQTPTPISIFTRIYFSNTHRPELGLGVPFSAAVAGLGNATSSSPQSQLYPAFVPLPDYDVVVQKTRYEATIGNTILEILYSNQIDTVILSGIRTSGVILSTAYRLFDLNFNVYVIGNNSIETPPDTPGIDQAIKQGIIPKLPANVITLEQAIAALARSGPDVEY